VKPIAILGVGPAGLMAAQACAMRGKMVALFSRGEPDTGPIKSRLGGAQFLHYPIPGINDVDTPDAEVRYVLCGDSEGYRRKVYGGDPNIPFVSMEHVRHNQVQPAWNLQATYDTLWHTLVEGTSVNVELIGPQWIEKALDNAWFETIFSTIPAPSICRSNAAMINNVHHFLSQKVNIATACILDNLPDNHVVYDGTPDRSWYRCSKLFGIGGTEWAADVKPPYGDLISVHKPIRTTCDCWTGQVLRLGRHGTWKKGILTHHAFVGAYDALQ
jgi:hypothetical protein